MIIGGWARHPMGCTLLPVPLLLPACHFSPYPCLPTQDKIRQSLELQPQKQEKKAKPLRARPSALDRFVC